MLGKLLKGAGMPRIYNYGIDHDRGGYLPATDPRFGVNEVGMEQIRAENEIFPPAFGRHYQFRLNDPQDATEPEMDEVFDWLSANNTGQWAWREMRSLNGAQITIHIHLERLTDQALMKQTWGHMFKHSPDTAYFLEALAVLKGVLPRNLSVNDFIHEHCMRMNIDFSEKDEDGKAVEKWIIAADTPEKAALFQQQWGSVFKPLVPGTSVSEANSTFIAEYREKAQFFIGICPEPPPKRTVPQDFIDYLEGRCDFSVVRTIHTGTASNMGLPAPDLGCK